MQRISNFGQAQIAAEAAIAAGHAAVAADNAIKVDKIQVAQEKKLEADSREMTYIRNLIYHLETTGTRYARTSRFRPGTPEFDNLLKKALASDMTYKGDCNADIFVPPTSSSKAGQPRAIWGKINKSGHLEPTGTLPLDVGPIWAAGCKNAQDKFRIAHVEAAKDATSFRYAKTIKSDIGTMGLFAAFGAGLFLLIVFFLSIKTQSAVIREQHRKPKAKPKKSR